MNATELASRLASPAFRALSREAQRAEHARLRDQLAPPPRTAAPANGGTPESPAALAQYLASPEYRALPRDKQRERHAELKAKFNPSK